MRVRLRPTYLAAAAASALLAAPAAATAADVSAAPPGSAVAQSVTTGLPALGAGSAPLAALEQCVHCVTVSATRPSIADRVQRSRTPQLPADEYEGMLVAAVGAGVTAGGWLLIVVGGRRLQRRAGRRS